MKKILSDSIIYVGGELFVKIFPFILLPILSRMLGPEQYGQISLFNAYASIFFVFVGLNSSAAIIKYDYTQTKYNTAEYFFSSVVLSTGMLFLLTIITFLIYRENIIILALVGGYFQSVYTNLVSINQSKKEAKKYLIAQILNAVISFGITLVLLCYFRASYELRVYAILAGFFISIVLSSCSNWTWLRNVHLHFDVFKKTAWQLITFGVPLIIHNLSFLVRSGLDRIMINKYYSSEVLGNYSASYQMSVIVTVVLLALSKSTTPHLYEQLNGGTISKRKFNMIFTVYFCVSVFISLIALCIPQGVYTFVAGDEYMDIKRFIVVMIPAFLSQGFYLIMASTCFFYGKNTAISYCTFIGGVLHCVLLYFVCKNLNVFYIPWVLFFSNSFVAVLMYYMIFRKIVSTSQGVMSGN